MQRSVVGWEMAKVDPPTFTLNFRRNGLFRLKNNRPANVRPQGTGINDQRWHKHKQITLIMGLMGW